jgi:ABC transporter substrate binding protein
MTTHIGRRELLAALSSAAAAWPLGARAQQPAKVPRVGILSPAASETADTLTAFREGIRDLGNIEGKTIALDFRLSKGNMDALPALAAELVRIPVNVIVTDSTNGMLAAFNATRTIPIVIGAASGDPVALGLAKSLSRPGNMDGGFLNAGSPCDRSWRWPKGATGNIARIRSGGNFFREFSRHRQQRNGNIFADGNDQQSRDEAEHARRKERRQIGPQHGAHEPRTVGG